MDINFELSGTSTCAWFELSSRVHAGLCTFSTCTLYYTWVVAEWRKCEWKLRRTTPKTLCQSSGFYLGLPWFFQCLEKKTFDLSGMLTAGNSTYGSIHVHKSLFFVGMKHHIELSRLWSYQSSSCQGFTVVVLLFRLFSLLIKGNYVLLVYLTGKSF